MTPNLKTNIPRFSFVKAGFIVLIASDTCRGGGLFSSNEIVTLKKMAACFFIFLEESLIGLEA